MEKGHTVDHKIVFGKLKAVAFFFIFGDNSETKPPFFCTFLSDVVESKESAVIGQLNSILEIVLNLSDLVDFQSLIPCW